jgi:endonuclease/exonuclease/phosphatase (EEP) superfamily protein YafD
MSNATVRKCAIGLFFSALAVPAVLSFVAFAARLWWRFDLCTHFRAHYLVALAIGTILSVLLRQFKAASIFGAVAILNLWFVAPLYLPAASDSKSGVPIRLMTVNAYFHNKDRSQLLQLIRGTRPDALLVLEVNEAWFNDFDGLADTYPYRIAEPRRDGWGIAFFSRLPCDQLEIREIGHAELPSTFAQLKLADGGSLSIIGSHPVAPFGRRHAGFRNQQLAALAEFAATLDGPVALIGDLNVTSWSPYFSDLIRTSGLRDSRKGFGVQSSWPTKLVPFGITIDHVLVSPEIAVRTRKIGADIGSDHRAVITDLLIPSNEN